MNYLGIIISVLALTLSAITLWLTRFKNGIIKMTRPTVIFLGPDKDYRSKVYIRTLLYSTSDKGQYIQNMYIRLQRGESVQNFNVWVYGEKELVRGSGLFVNKSGIAYNHHFILPKDGTKYSFLSGEYLLQIYIETVNKNPRKIFEQKLTLTKTQEETMLTDSVGTYFDWAPNTQNYHSHVDSKKHSIFT